MEKNFPHNVRNFATRMKHFRKIVIRGLLKKLGEFSNFAGYVHSIFDFVFLCWYSCPECLFAVSAI